MVMNWVKNFMHNKQQQSMVGHKEGLEGNVMKPGQQAKLVKEPSIESCESASEEPHWMSTEELNQGASSTIPNEMTLLGRLCDIDRETVTLFMMSNGEQFRIPRKSIKDPICGGYYKLTGAFIDNGDLFSPKSITAVSEESKFVLDQRAKLSHEKYGDEFTMQKLVDMGIEAKMLNIDTEEDATVTKMPTENMDAKKEETNSIDTEESTTETRTPSEILAIRNLKNMKKASSKSTSFESFASSPCSSLSLKNVRVPATYESVSLVYAVVLSFHGKANVRMFSLNGSIVPITFHVFNKDLEPPICIGKWYSLNVSGMYEADKPVLEPLEKARELLDSKPIRTRVSRGRVQFYVNISLDNEQTERGFKLCFSDKFPQAIVDSAGFLEKLGGQPSKPVIRHAPSNKIGIWCEQRKYPIQGICWQVAGVDVVKPKQQHVMRNEEPIKQKIEGKENKTENKQKAVRKKDKPVELKQNDVDQKKAPEMTKSSVPLVRNMPHAHSTAPIEQNLSEMLDGLVCSQTAAHYLVYSTEKQWVAFLDKKRCKQDNLLGVWIKFQARDINGTKYVENYTFGPPKIDTIPTPEYVLLNCGVRVPRALEGLSEQPWVEELCANVFDKHSLLRQQHHGRTVKATIGTPTHATSNDLQWHILQIG